MPPRPSTASTPYPRSFSPGDRFFTIAPTAGVWPPRAARARPLADLAAHLVLHHPSQPGSDEEGPVGVWLDRADDVASVQLHLRQDLVRLGGPQRDPAVVVAGGDRVLVDEARGFRHDVRLVATGE